MEIIKKLDLKIKKFFGGNDSKRSKLILVCGCVGILLIFLSELLPENKAEHYYKNHSVSETIDEENELEKRIEKAVSQIKGAGRTEVTITLDSSDEYFYAKNSSENYDESEENTEYELVIIEGQNGEEPLLIKTYKAKIRGVLIVCDGGNNPLVCEKIIDAVCALLNVPSNKVSVAEMA